MIERRVEEIDAMLADRRQKTRAIEAEIDRLIGKLWASLTTAKPRSHTLPTEE